MKRSLLAITTSALMLTAAPAHARPGEFDHAGFRHGNDRQHRPVIRQAGNRCVGAGGFAQIPRNVRTTGALRALSAHARRNSA
jgi:hypothetical protein